MTPEEMDLYDKVGQLAQMARFQARAIQLILRKLDIDLEHSEPLDFKQEYPCDFGGQNEDH